METQVTRVLAVVAVLLVATTACSDSTESEEELSHHAFDCSNPIDILDEPPDGWSTVLDVIALPDDPALQRGRFDDSIGRSFSKFGLVIRADEPLSLRIAATSRPNAVMSWNMAPAEPVESIEVSGCSGTCATDWQPSCPLGQSGAWIAYPGGVWTVDPACIEIEIAKGDQDTLARLPIGMECV